MTRAFVVRHGESLANRDGVLSSEPPGAALSARGRQQAADCARLLSSHTLTRIYASPLLRTRETAAALAAVAGVQVTVEDDLREFGLGAWEGRPGTDQDVLEHPVFADWLRQRRLDHGFENGESGLELGARLQRVLDRVRAESPPGDVALVTHGGLMAVAIPLLAPGAPGAGRIPHNCEVVALRHDGVAWRGATIENGGRPG